MVIHKLRHNIGLVVLYINQIVEYKPIEVNFVIEIEYCTIMRKMNKDVVKYLILS